MMLLGCWSIGAVVRNTAGAVGATRYFKGNDTMKKKLLSVLLSACMLATALVLPSSAAGSYTGTDNERKVYEFAINRLGVNGAVASAILANIYSESGFRPTASAMESDGYISYGICQWHKGRYDALQSYCSEHGLDYTTIEGQLEYLKYELENGERSAYSKIRDAENTAEGAYTASYNWAKYFERCSSVYYERRAALARDSFWPLYGGEVYEQMELRGITYPSSIAEGAHFSIYGTVVSPRALSEVAVRIYNSSGDAVIESVIDAAALGGANYYDIHRVDRSISFNKLSRGSYKYDIYALDKLGYAVRLSLGLTVGDETVSSTASSSGSYHDHGNKLGYGWNSGEIIIEPSVEEDGLIMYTCYCGAQKTEVIPKLSGDYRITYDAGEGSGAPFPQGKAEGKPMIISPIKPTREGYDFLGWATAPEASEPEYLAEGQFDIDADTTLYAVWRRQVIPLSGIKAGKSYISLLPGESCVLEYSPVPANATDCTVSVDGWDETVIDCDGTAITALSPGQTRLRLFSGEVETFITVCVAPADHVPGDINGDGVVDTRDLIRLMRSISGADVESVFVDVNGDGMLDTRDLIRLMKYISGAEVTVM